MSSAEIKAVVKEKVKDGAKSGLQHFLHELAEFAAGAIFTGLTFKSGSAAIAYIQKRWAESHTPLVKTDGHVEPVKAQPLSETREEMKVLVQGKAIYGKAIIQMVERDINLAMLYREFERQLARTEPHSAADLLKHAAHRQPDELADSLMDVSRGDDYQEQRHRLYVQGLTEHASESGYPTVKMKHAEEIALQEAEKIWHGFTFWMAAHRPPKRDKSKRTAAQKAAHRLVRR